MSRRVLIAGCGDVGTALGLQLAAAGDEVHGLRRHPAQLPAAIRPLAGDLSRPDSLRGAAGAWDAVVFLPTPGGRDETSYRRVFVDGLAALLDRVSTPRLLYVSSTSVYGQDDGSWVDESAVTEPAGFSGEVLLAGEALARERVAGTTVIRFAGIYGPGRERLLRAASMGEPVQVEPLQWTNRIHRDDCAGLLAHVLGLAQPADCYLGVDDCPAPRHEVMLWLADQLGVPQPKLVRSAGGSANKRVSNQRIRATGFRCRWPDYRAGYADLLRHPDALA